MQAKLQMRSLFAVICCKSWNKFNIQKTTQLLIPMLYSDEYCLKDKKNAHKNSKKINAQGDVEDAYQLFQIGKGTHSLDIYINLPFHLFLGGYLAGPLWLGPALAPSGPAARGARWQRARPPSSFPGSPPGLYSTCPSSAAAGSPPPGAGPPPRAAGLQREKSVRLAKRRNLRKL